MLFTDNTDAKLNFDHEFEVVEAYMERIEHRKKARKRLIK